MTTGHMFAEIDSRYVQQCVFCYVSTLSPLADRPCPHPKGEALRREAERWDREADAHAPASVCECGHTFKSYHDIYEGTSCIAWMDTPGPDGSRACTCQRFTPRTGLGGAA